MGVDGHGVVAQGCVADLLLLVRGAWKTGCRASGAAARVGRRHRAGARVVSAR